MDLPVDYLFQGPRDAGENRLPSYIQYVIFDIKLIKTLRKFM